MRYLIDGYNLFFKLQEELLPLEEKREAFIQLLDDVVGELKLQALIVFDSHYQNSTHFASKRKLVHIEVSFSPKNLSADQYLLELLEWDSKNTMLVTSDRELSKNGSFLGAKTLSIEGFVNFILKKQTKKMARGKATMQETKANFDRLHKAFQKKLDENDEE
ncbi:MAG: NYN domain-containing protein [Simkaniaceae bacterium]|nr:MAG: NYN domain-containing protein [Simkaniaceae bacterium]